MDRITSNGCARNDRITRDEVECNPVVPGTAQVLMMSHCVNMLRQKKIYLLCLIPFLYEKTHLILAINIVIAQIAISNKSSPSGAWFYVIR